MEDSKDARKRQLAAVISQARISRDMTQQALADAVGCNLRLVREWEAGRSFPGWEFTRRLALTFGFTGDQMLLLERVSDPEALPILAWEKTRDELAELDETLRAALHQLGAARNVLGRPPGAAVRSDNTGALARASRRRAS